MNTEKKVKPTQTEKRLRARLKAIEKIVYANRGEMDPLFEVQWNIGYEAGQRDMARQIRKILHAPHDSRRREVKKKVRDSLEVLRQDINSSDNADVDGEFTTVNREVLRTLVKWAEKKAAKSEKIKVGNTVELVADIEYMYGTLPKGMKGKVTRTDVYDPYDIAVMFEGRSEWDDNLSFKLSEVRKVR